MKNRLHNKEQANKKIGKNDKSNNPLKKIRKGSNMTKSDAIVWKICIIISTIFITALVIYLANKDMPIYKQDTKKTTYEVAKVLKVLEDKTQKDEITENIKKGTISLKIRVLSGKHKDKEYTIENHLSAMYNVDVHKGDKVSIRIDERNDGNIDVSIYNYYRVNAVIGCIIVFASILIIVGGYKGFKALLGVIFTMVMVIGVLLPLTLKGYSPIIVTLLIVFIGTVVSLLLIDGWTRKTRVAIIGTMGGIIVGTLFAVIASKIMHVTTYQMDEAESLLLVMQSTGLKVKNLFICGILISCMGAVMDVAMSISSAIEELRLVDNNIASFDLFKSAMNIGRDAMGTMANTLILAFAGNSLNMMILICSYGVSFQQLINTDFVAIEIISAIAGSVGIILAVPLVSFVGAYGWGMDRNIAE